LARREIESGTYDVDAYLQELESAPDNLQVGGCMWLENAAIRVWEVGWSPLVDRGRNALRRGHPRRLADAGQSTH
jgi:hypothetical protein